MKEKFLLFWKSQPALLIGLLLMLGSALALTWHWSLLLPLACLIYLSPSPIKSALITLVFVIYSKLFHPHSDINQAAGKGHFSIHSLKVEASPFHQSYAYIGTLKNFESIEGDKARNIPCKIYLPLKTKRPPANRDYLVEGTLINNQFKANKKSSWEMIPYTFSLAEWRFQAKQLFSRYIKHHLKNKEVASFMTTLTTGDIEERFLAFEFSKLGLQHILAISGFHFGLLALFVGFILRLIFPLKPSAAILFILLTAYFIFIGNSPSVQRAWITLSIFLVGYLFNLRSTALNAMGVALMIELLVEPLSITHIGFQLSFTATLALLLFYPPFDQLLKKIFPKRPLKVIATMSSIDQHGYLLSAFLRKSLALNFAVHFLTLPILLFLFHKFPLLSLLYNLFVPSLVGFSLLLLLLSIPFPFLHALNNGYTSLLLDLIAHPPALFNYFFYFHSISFPFLIILLCGLFITGVLLQSKKWIG